MKKFTRTGLLVSVISILSLLFSLNLVFAAEIPNFEFPVLITSAGQCPQAEIVGVFADLGGLKYDYHTMPDIGDLAAGVGLGGLDGGKVNTDLALYPKGTPYKTVFITMGASMKGMGAAGISADFENGRVEKMVAWFKEQGVAIIGVHIAGEDRRHHHLSEGLIDRVGPYADLLLIAHASDADDRFTKLSQEHDIPMILIDTEFDLVEIVPELFQ